MTDAPPPPTPRPPGGSIDRALSSAIRLNRALTGNLPCIICGYDLKGVTIRGSCPECGTLVRATILYTVDPEAEEFRPLLTPTITAWSVALWSIFGFAAILAAWWVRAADAVRHIFGFFIDTAIAQWTLLGFVVLSGVSLIGMIRPTARAPWRGTVWAIIALAAYAPLVYLLVRLRAWDASHASPYFPWNRAASALDISERELVRLGIGACIATIVLAARPNARELVRRSLAMRSGRVDRQTLLALAGAIGVAALGDALRLAAGHLPIEPGAIVDNIGSVLIAVGSMFMTLGIASSVIDSWRIRSVILLPAPSLHEVLGPDAIATPPTPLAAGGSATDTPPPAPPAR